MSAEARLSMGSTVGVARPSLTAGIAALVALLTVSLLAALHVGFQASDDANYLTGALGWIGPDGAMQTSILIRTFVADGRQLTLHVGGGITYRSDPAEEWEETVAKARGPLGAIGAIEGIVAALGERVDRNNRSR